MSQTLKKALNDLKLKSKNNFQKTIAFNSLKNEIVEQTKFLGGATYSERVFCILNDINKIPTCPACDKEIIFNQKYNKFCSVSCCSSDKGIQQKKKDTCLKNYGVEHPLQSETLKLKAKETLLSNYGVKNPSQNEEIKQKKKDTCLKNYGVEHQSQSFIVQDKIKKTCLVRYGVNSFSKTDTFKEQYKKTCLANHGVENVFQSEEIKKKIKDTCLKNYGVDNPQQNRSIHEKTQVSLFRTKVFTMPSGKCYNVQGYEPQILTELLNHFNEDDICIGSEVPLIQYELNKNNHIYHPDIYIKSRNMIIEVKSLWTLEGDLEKNFAKRQACLDAGFNFWFTVGV
jgi:hypothetical protein